MDIYSEIAGIKHTGTVLDQIVASKPEQIERLNQQYPVAQISQGLKPSTNSLFEALKADNASYILECKKASPSKGLIRDVFDLDEICAGYKNHASAVSVLTDEKYFQGNFEFVRQVRKQLTQPILCKDFFVDSYQIVLARYMGADAILLMLSVLDDDKYVTLSDFAATLGMDVLTEVSNQQELERAVSLDAKIIGINNRDLRDLSIDLNTTKILAPQVTGDRVIISESGISKHQQITDLAPFVDAFLVGSSLMSQPDIDLACRELIFGHNKICGMSNPETAIAAAASGTVYGGLIFAKKSPRFVTLTQAQEITDTGVLRFVGVFVNEEIATIADYTKQLSLFAVQLHGGEDNDYVRQLREALHDDCQIWRALRSDQLTDIAASPLVDRLLIDSAVTTDHSLQFGGTGLTFDWELVSKDIRGQSMLAGGLNIDNIKQAASCGFIGLDVNSGVESSPGVKDLVQIKKLMQHIREY